uniref:Kazal-like domain-containing protein n=1 Tax=Eptatretus burgeri TaxID=7764 RepID=A0A8C4QQ19_EPTBU
HWYIEAREEAFVKKQLVLSIWKDDRWHGWNLAKPFDQGLDPAKDPCRNVKCGRYKVCIAQAYRTAVCISRRHLAHSMKKLKESPKPISSMSVMTCKHCRVRTPSPVCGSDDHTYSSLVMSYRNEPLHRWFLTFYFLA